VAISSAAGIGILLKVGCERTVDIYLAAILGSCLNGQLFGDGGIGAKVEQFSVEGIAGQDPFIIQIAGGEPDIRGLVAAGNRYCVGEGIAGIVKVPDVVLLG